MMNAEIENVESNSSGATITVRLIRSFEYRNFKFVVFKDVALTQTVGDFMEAVISDLKERREVPPPFRSFLYDTMKIQHKAHGAKTNDPVINTEDDERLILRQDCTLQASGVENETEIAFFKKEDYKKYQACPVLKW